MKDCYIELTDSYRCNSCAFSGDGKVACANPRIWEEPPRDSYFKSRAEPLTEIEVKSIDEHL